MSSREKHRQQLSAYIDGQLSPHEMRHMEEALADDADLARECEQLRAVKKLLRGLPKEKAPQDFVARVLARAERSQLVAATSHHQDRPRHYWLRHLATAAVVLIAVSACAVILVSLVNAPAVNKGQRRANGPMLASSEKPGDIHAKSAGKVGDGRLASDGSASADSGMLMKAQLPAEAETTNIELYAENLPEAFESVKNVLISNGIEPVEQKSFDAAASNIAFVNNWKAVRNDEQIQILAYVPAHEAEQLQNQIGNAVLSQSASNRLLRQTEIAGKMREETSYAAGVAADGITGGMAGDVARHVDSETATRDGIRAKRLPDGIVLPAAAAPAPVDQPADGAVGRDVSGLDESYIATKDGSTTQPAMAKSAGPTFRGKAVEANSQPGELLTNEQIASGTVAAKKENEIVEEGAKLSRAHDNGTVDAPGSTVQAEQPAFQLRQRNAATVKKDSDSAAASAPQLPASMPVDLDQKQVAESKTRFVVTVPVQAPASAPARSSGALINGSLAGPSASRPASAQEKIVSQDAHNYALTSQTSAANQQLTRFAQSSARGVAQNVQPRGQVQSQQRLIINLNSSSTNRQYQSGGNMLYWSNVRNSFEPVATMSATTKPATSAPASQNGQ